MLPGMSAWFSGILFTEMTPRRFAYRINVKANRKAFFMVKNIPAVKKKSRFNH